MLLLTRKKSLQSIRNERFGPPYAVVNVSKVGLRYFRIMIKCSRQSRDRLVAKLVDHPNAGWVLSAEGWFNLAVGLWARNNAEIIDISTQVRNVLGEDDEIVYQSELTSLYGFGNRLLGEESSPMPIVDAVYEPVQLSALELDYIKLITLDSSLPSEELAEIMGVTIDEVENIGSNLQKSGVIVGTQERVQYSDIYFKVFVDTMSKKKHDAVETLINKLWNDPKCIYVERANGKYDLEFELILPHKSDLNAYLRDFTESKTAILTTNLYTNLYPLSKTANLKEIRETLAVQEGDVIDFRNSKLWYLNHQAADAYLNIYENKKYFEVMEKGELDLFDEITSYLRDENQNVVYSVIDIGSGDGMKGRVFIEKLGEEKAKAYYPIDIQPIELATALRSHAEGAYAKHPTLLNIENLGTRFPLQLPPNEKQLYVFFGGTYGNFQSSVINEYLIPVLNDSSSKLLIAMPIVAELKSEEEIINSYVGHQFETMTFGPLAQMGLKTEQFEKSPHAVDMAIHIAIEDNRLVSSYVLAEDSEVSSRIFKKGTVFKMTTSWKPTLQQFTDALETHFKIEKVFKNSDMAIALVGKRS